jgi:uncharacterized protein (TIGR03083 family)
MDVTMTHEEASELLGVWALDACEESEAASVERHLESCADCRAEAAMLRRAAAGLGELGRALLRPPERLGQSVSELAVSASSPAALFGHQVRALTRLLDAVSGLEWAASTSAGWTVQELVGHLLAGVSYINWQLGLLSADPGGGELMWLPRSEAVIADQRENQPARTVREWRAQADVLQGHLAAAAGDDLRVTIPWFGNDTPLRVVAVIHAFETWVHAEDIRQATGRPPDVPTPADLESMSRLAAQLLGSALSASPTASGRTARLALTGAGGGELSIPPGTPPTAPDTTVTADVVTFCRLIGGRVRLADFPHRVEGDPELARELVETATSFAFP